MYKTIGLNFYLLTDNVCFDIFLCFEFHVLNEIEMKLLARFNNVNICRTGASYFQDTRVSKS